MIVLTTTSDSITSEQYRVLKNGIYPSHKNKTDRNMSAEQKFDAGVYRYDAAAYVKALLTARAHADGFNDAVQRTVKENCSTMKFEISEFGSS